MFEDNAEYDRFVEKFKPQKTTDDCYTPPLVYDAIRDWVCKRYGIDPETIVRPFYPGGDYEQFEYPAGCLVLDNPPFSILSRICKFYLEHGTRFFLFAPSLTVFTAREFVHRMNHIVCDADITYENGAKVKTAFVTNLDADTIAETAPDLRTMIVKAMEKVKAETAKELPKYEYPRNVLTAAMLQKYAHCGVNYSVRRRECKPIVALDEQREQRKVIFGSGLLLSEKATAEKEAAEKEAEEAAGKRKRTWQLSERELQIIRAIGHDSDGGAGGKKLESGRAGAT